MENLPKPTEQANYIGFGITVLALIGIAWFVDLGAVRTWIEGAGVWGPLVFILLKISTVVIAPLSGSPLYPLVGLLFGFWPGILYVVIGDFLAYTISFYISRIFGQKFVYKILSGKEGSIVTRIIDHISDTKGFLQACMTFFALPEVLSYGAGLARIKYWKFILIIMPFEIFAASILVFFGSILDPQSGSIWITLGIPILGAIAVIVGGTFFIQGVMGKKEGESL